MIRYISLALLLCCASAFAQTPNGYINPPVYGTGLIPEVKSGTVTTTIVASQNHPVNLIVYNIFTINNWTILLPNPSFDGQLITVSCQSTVATLSVQSTDGSTVSSGVPATCTVNSNFTLQWSTIYNTWYMAIGPVSGGGGGGSTLTVTDGTHTVTGATTEIFPNSVVSGSTPNATITAPVGITINDNSNTIPGITTLTFIGGLVSGSAPNGVFTISQQPIAVGITQVTGGTDTYILTDNAGVLGNIPVPTGIAGITFTDGVRTVTAATQLTAVSGAVIGGSTPNATITVPNPGWTLTDGTHTIAATTQVTVTGATVGGSSPNGTLTINPSSLIVGSTTVASGTSGFALTDNAGVLGNAPIPTLTYAANADIWAHTDTVKIINSAIAATSIAPQTFTESAGTFSVDFASGINLELPLVHADCPCTIANPTNVYAGLSGNLTLIQSATGSDTIGTWGTTWKFSSGVKPVLTTTASAIDVLPFYCRTTTFCVVTDIANAQ